MAWNHSIAYFPWVLRQIRDALGPHASSATAIDVGTGDGELAARLTELVGGRVLGVDLEPEQVAIARARHPQPERLEYAQFDLVGPQSTQAVYDAVVCVATIHHVELATGLARLRALTAPGGVLVIVGLGLATTPAERLRSLLATVVSGVTRRVLGWYDHGAPMQRAHQSYSEIAEVVARELPGAQFRRRLYWRYSVVWRAEH